MRYGVSAAVCACMIVCLGLGRCSVTADCAGFYCGPYSLVNSVQFKVKTNKISFLSVVRIRTMVLR